MYIGLDIGGTKCAVILGEYQGTKALYENLKDNMKIYEPNSNSFIDEEMKILDRIAFPTEVSKGVQFTLNNIFKSIELILTKNNKKIDDVFTIGISCGGPLDSKGGIIMSPPNLLGWDMIPIVEIIENKFGVKTKLQNDANACAMAEWKFGAGKGYNNIVFLTFGTGMGAGLILDGRLYSGTNDMAGEVGHLRLENNGPVGYGKAGSFEGFCSGGGIAQLARTKVLEKLQCGEKVDFCKSIDKLEELNAEVVGKAAEKGDELAIEIYKACGQYLGRGISIIIDILNPEIIIIGSIFTRQKQLLLPSALKIINEESLIYSRKVCKIEAAALGEQIGDYGALAVALND